MDALKAVSYTYLSRWFNLISQEYGNEFSALMLRLEILAGEDRPSCQEYFEGKLGHIALPFDHGTYQTSLALRAAVQVIEVTDNNVEL